METLKAYWAKLLIWLKANMTIVYIVISVITAIFVLPKLYKMFFKKRRTTYRRRNHIIPRSVGLHRSPSRGKGSEYMRRKMARLRSMRRRKR